MHATSEQVCLAYTFPLRTRFIVLVMLPNRNNSAEEPKQRNQIQGATLDRHPRRTTWRSNTFMRDQQIISYLPGISEKVLQQ